MNGLTLLALVVLAIGVFVAYRAGVMRGRNDRVPAGSPVASPSPSPSPLPQRPVTADEARAECDSAADERARLVRSLEAEATALRGDLSSRDAEATQLRKLAEDRRRLHAALAVARAETARFRQIVVDLENNAPPPLLDQPGSPDDLKLIVGVGPVLERMLQQLGIATYRQIARWSERDIDAFDAKLPEFPGRIRRDGWVTQARELHHSKYGEVLPPRDRV